MIKTPPLAKPAFFVALGVFVSQCVKAPPPAPAPAPAPPVTRACTPHGGHSVAALSDALARYGKALALAERAGAQHEAAQALARLISEYPWFAPAHFEAGVVAEAQGRPLDAYQAYKHFLMFDEVHAQDRARVRAALAALEGQSPLLKTYAGGERAAQAGQWREVIAAMDAVIAQGRSFALAHRLRAIAYAASARSSEAVSDYRAYLSLDRDAPDAPEVRTLIARAATTP